jgi:hypothetical protein
MFDAVRSGQIRVRHSPKEGGKPPAPFGNFESVRIGDRTVIPVSRDTKLSDGVSV